MQIRINKNGELEIMRAGKWKKVNCPFNYKVHCGDWCPLFGEPDGNELGLCHVCLDCKPIEDQRVHEEMKCKNCTYFEEHRQADSKQNFIKWGTCSLLAKVLEAENTPLRTVDRLWVREDFGCILFHAGVENDQKQKRC